MTQTTEENGFWRRGSRTAEAKGAHGFTLIELTIILIIMGILFSLVMPRIINITNFKLKSTTRRMVRTINHIYSRATTHNRYYRLGIDLTTDEYWVSADTNPSPGMLEFMEEDIIRKQLPEGIHFTDVFHLGQLEPKKEDEEVYTYFSPKGRIDPPTVIHLADERDRYYTLFIPPYTGRVQVIQGYEEVYEETEQ